MKTVNLLPEFYRRALRQKQMLRLHGAALAALTVALGAGAYAARSRFDGLARQRAALAQAVAQNRISSTLRRDQYKLKQLNRLQLASATIGQPLPNSDLLQQILNAMPRHTALRQLSMHMTRREIMPTGPAKKHATPRYQFAMQVNLTAVAPTQEAVNHCIERLGHNALFGNVVFAVQPAIIRHRLARQFKLEFRVHVDRLYGLRVASAALAGARRQ